MKRIVMMLLLSVALTGGCAFFHSWKAIPPPGGCDQCHTLPINADWQIAYRPAIINDETGRYPWQQPESLQPVELSQLEEKKITEQRCFRCHKGPDKAHSDYQGRYHH